MGDFGWPSGDYATNTFTQITNNDYEEKKYQIHAGEATWMGYDGNDYEIYHYSSQSNVITQITNNQYDDVDPQISNGKITWVGTTNYDDYYGYGEEEIYLYDGENIKELSFTSSSDRAPNIDNGVVAWYSGDDLYMAFHPHPISLDRDQGSSGTIVTIEGQNFTPDGQITSISLYQTSEWYNVSVVGDTITILNDGTFTGQFIVPAVSVGTYKVIVKDNFGKFGISSLNISEATTLQITPNYGPSGTLVQINGNNFAKIEGSNVNIEIWRSYIHGTTTIDEKLWTFPFVQANANGEFDITVEVPDLGYPSGRLYRFEAKQEEFNIRAINNFYYADAHLNVSPESGLPDTDITLFGYGARVGAQDFVPYLWNHNWENTYGYDQYIQDTLPLGRKTDTFRLIWG